MVTSPAKVTTPTYTSSGTVEMYSRAATLAASKRLPSIDMLVSIASTEVRRTVVSLSTGAAVASAALPSTVTDTPSRSTSASAGTETRTLRLPGLASTWVMEPSAASAAEGSRASPSAVIAPRLRRAVRAVRFTPAPGRR